MPPSFTLRPWQLTDLNSLVKYANNEKIASKMTDQFPHPYLPEHGERFLKMVTAPTPPNVLCIDIDGEACGGIGIHPKSDIERFNAELGYWLAEPFWGKGIITEAIKKIVEYGFDNFKINRIYARPFGNNPASQKVLEKAGFKLEGRLEKTLFKNGEFTDELIYAIRK